MLAARRQSCGTVQRLIEVLLKLMGQLSIRFCCQIFWRFVFAMKVPDLKFNHQQFWLACTISLLMVSSAFAQSKPKVVPAAPEVPAGACVIAEFRHLALTTHDPLERQNKAIEWLKTSGSFCSPMQMSILISSKAALLGTADSVTLGAVIDGIMEKRMGADHGAVSRYYRPEVQGPAKGREEAPASKTNESGPAPKATAGGAAGGAAPAGTVVAVAGAPGSAPAMGGAPNAAGATPNININMGGAKPPEEDMSRKYPLPTEPMFVFPPEFGTPVLNYFGKIRRQFVRSFFMETLSPGKCPEGMNWRNDACETGFKVAWKFGEKLPTGAKTYPVEPKLVEKLNFDPGYTFVRVGGDILALERDTGKVADAVLNLGKAT